MEVGDARKNPGSRREGFRRIGRKRIVAMLPARSIDVVAIRTWRHVTSRGAAAAAVAPRRRRRRRHRRPSASCSLTPTPVWHDLTALLQQQEAAGTSATVVENLRLFDWWNLVIGVFGCWSEERPLASAHGSASSSRTLPGIILHFA